MVNQLGDNSPDGMNLGLSITEKFGFYGTTPIVQRSGSAGAGIVSASAVIATSGGSFAYATSAQANGVVTLVNELRNWAVAQGFIKGS